MSLPSLIEIKPLAGPVRAEVNVPGSKSITNRALILAALADGTTTLRGALWSEDTQVMVACLKKIGFDIGVLPGEGEPSNRTLVVRGQGGRVPGGGVSNQDRHPIELFVGNAGTAARFLAALCSLGGGRYALHGVPRMHERPQAALFRALRELGYRVDAPNDRLPAVIHGAGPRAGACAVSVAESSQFASALLLCASAGRWDVSVSGNNEDELPYVEMTRELVRIFPRHGGQFQIEPDASSGSYFIAADWLARSHHPSSGVSVRHWPVSRWQIDAAFPSFLPLPRVISRRTDLGDSIMTALVLAPFSEQPVRFDDLGRLRVQECERVLALRTELRKCGVEVEEAGDTLTVRPAGGRLRGATVETYHDHRMAMCFAILGLKVPGLRLKNPACVKKTFPNFFQKLAAAPPLGLGVEIMDATAAVPSVLSVEQLFAD